MKKSCAKCGHESENLIELQNKILCNICYQFAPDKENDLEKYCEEKIDSSILETFRKFSITRGEKQKRGMIQKAITGLPMSRPAFGYFFENGNLIPATNFREVEEIFEEFLNTNISLTKLSKKHNLSVNGLKKILRNFTYIGKIRFNNQIHEGNHQSIISSTLFNHVQNKLERLKIK